MEAINKFSNQLIIILIAYLLNTVKTYNIVYKLDKGKIIGKDVND